MGYTAKDLDQWKGRDRLRTLAPTDGGRYIEGTARHAEWMGRRALTFSTADLASARTVLAVLEQEAATGHGQAKVVWTELAANLRREFFATAADA